MEKQFQRTEDGHLILMSKEERNLLITDLTARINYGVICLIERVDDFGPRFRNQKLTGFCYHDDGGFYFDFGGLNVAFAEKVKPYLRPMSSMTEEEFNEFEEAFGFPFEADYDTITKKTTVYNSIVIDKGYCVELDLDKVALMLDWLNAHHFDYRGLIEKGLALEAPEDMYKRVI